MTVILPLLELAVDAGRSINDIIGWDITAV